VLDEAARVVRPGGVIAAAAISRLAPLLGSVRAASILDPRVLANVRDETRAGRRVPPDRRTGLFPQAWFHRPDELRSEVEEAGLELHAVVGVQGPAWLLDGFAERWQDDEQRERILAAAEAFEEDEHVAELSPHLLAIARRRA
jgi:hypothetical protein